MALQTEYPFTLPNGFVEQDGGVHKSGIMRLATAADEILPQKDPRVPQRNPAVSGRVQAGHTRRGKSPGDRRPVCPGFDLPSGALPPHQWRGGLDPKNEVSALQRSSGDESQPGGIVGYPRERVYEEVAFLGYYLHWNSDTILDMSHSERRTWCEEVSKINQQLTEDPTR